MSGRMQITFDETCRFIDEPEAYPGVKRIAEQVMRDIELVTDKKPCSIGKGEKCGNLVIYGTLGRSSCLQELEARGIFSSEPIRGKWETYVFQVVDNPLDGVSHALIIAGSDKRGTIYGLYHLSELLGVSPLVNWNHVMPEKKKNAVLSDQVNFVSKEPSVKYRGFFINDEWPAFGNWAQKHFGGINAKCYERVFELLLRLKGNYLWPAMWSSNFSLDGPGLDSARLADELGVVMSTSHHEPCMRSGEEYGLLRGRDSSYGDAWDFRKNEQGITRFWRDGLLRNKAFENVITMGMRGERDSAILGKEAGLSENIALLRDVLKTQNRLIRENVCEDLEKVPRQIVLFTEVEEFFYGDEKTKGLMDDPELDGVTLMLSDNNFGYTRTLPTEKMRSHRGGFGMYYHMDMHGGAYSYQWIGSAYLPRIWEQMTQAYEFGVREIWVTNIGDIGTQEYGLSFFLDLAYDMERWGGQDASVTVRYTKEWVQRQFGAAFSEEQLKAVNRILWDYTGLLAKRKHEIMNEDVFHPVHFGEAERILETSEEILQCADTLKAAVGKEHLSAFISLLYFPACGTANLMKMWILASKNKLYAEQNRIEANELAAQIEACVQMDDALITEYEQTDGGCYEGFGRSEHIGFINWNEEDNKYPVRRLVFGANQPRMLVSKANDEHYMTGLPWCDAPQVWQDALRQDVDEIEFDLSNGSRIPFEFKITTECKWMSFSKTSGKVDVRERIVLTIHRELFDGKAEGNFCVENVGYAKANIRVEAANRSYPEGIFVENDGHISMKARHYMEKHDVEKGGFQILSPYGRGGSAIKVFPATADFLKDSDRPYVEYRFMTGQEAVYRIYFYLAPTTPVVFEREQYLGFSLNDGEVRIINTVEKTEIPYFLSPQWAREARENIKLTKTDAICKKGINTLRFYGVSPAIVLEKIVIVREGATIPDSYLGPSESMATVDEWHG